MKAYKIYYNADEKRVDLLEFDIAYEFDFSYDPDSNIDGEDHCHNCDLKSITESVEKLNNRILEGDLEVFKCKNCDKYFFVSQEEKLWYMDMNMKPPKRCSDCRAKRRHTNN